MPRITLKVVPRSRREGVEGPLADGSYKVHVHAPPVDGAANAAVIEALAKHFGTAKSRVRIVKGETGKNKIVDVEN